MPRAPRIIDWFDGTDYEFLSNFYPSEIEVPSHLTYFYGGAVRGVKASTVEEVYQALKATTHLDLYKVLAPGNPSSAKVRGNTIKLRPDWDRCLDCGVTYKRSGQFHQLEYDQGERAWLGDAPFPDHEHRTTAERVMLECLQSKFAIPELRDKLLATGDAYLCEGNTWHDQTWGSCRCFEHGLTPGRNLLGRLLMDVRAELHS